MRNTSPFRCLEVISLHIEYSQWSQTQTHECWHFALAGGPLIEVAWKHPESNQRMIQQVQQGWTGSYPDLCWKRRHWRWWSFLVMRLNPAKGQLPCMFTTMMAATGLEVAFLSLCDNCIGSMGLPWTNVAFPRCCRRIRDQEDRDHPIVPLAPTSPAWKRWWFKDIGDGRRGHRQPGEWWFWSTYDMPGCGLPAFFHHTSSVRASLSDSEKWLDLATISQETPLPNVGLLGPPKTW